GRWRRGPGRRQIRPGGARRRALRSTVPARPDAASGGLVCSGPRRTGAAPVPSAAMAGSRRVPEGPDPDPAVQKLRVRYAKRGRMRFTSTRDFQRALERAVRKAVLPMAYSGGFHPHPKTSYANAAPTGAASEAEYV